MTIFDIIFTTLFVLLVVLIVLVALWLSKWRTKMVHHKNLGLFDETFPTIRKK